MNRVHHHDQHHQRGDHSSISQSLPPALLLPASSAALPPSSFSATTAMWSSLRAKDLGSIYSRKCMASGIHRSKRLLQRLRMVDESGDGALIRNRGGGVGDVALDFSDISAPSTPSFALATECIGLAHVKSVVLARCHLATSDMEHIAHFVAMNPAITTLDVSGNRELGLEGARTIVDLVHHKSNLVHVMCQDCNLSAATEGRIQSACLTNANMLRERAGAAVAALQRRAQQIQQQQESPSHSDTAVGAQQPIVCPSSARSIGSTCGGTPRTAPAATPTALTPLVTATVVSPPQSHARGGEGGGGESRGGTAVMSSTCSTNGTSSSGAADDPHCHGHTRIADDISPQRKRLQQPQRDDDYRSHNAAMSLSSTASVSSAPSSCASTSVTRELSDLEVSADIYLVQPLLTLGRLVAWRAPLTTSICVWFGLLCAFLINDDALTTVVSVAVVGWWLIAAPHPRESRSSTRRHAFSTARFSMRSSSCSSGEGDGAMPAETPPHPLASLLGALRSKVDEHHQNQTLLGLGQRILSGILTFVVALLNGGERSKGRMPPDQQRCAVEWIYDRFVAIHWEWIRSRHALDGDVDATPEGEDVLRMKRWQSASNAVAAVRQSLRWRSTAASSWRRCRQVVFVVATIALGAHYMSNALQRWRTSSGDETSPQPIIMDGSRAPPPPPPLSASLNSVVDVPSMAMLWELWYVCSRAAWAAWVLLLLGLSTMRWWLDLVVVVVDSTTSAPLSSPLHLLATANTHASSVAAATTGVPTTAERECVATRDSLTAQLSTSGAEPSAARQENQQRQLARITITPLFSATSTAARSVVAEGGLPPPCSALRFRLSIPSLTSTCSDSGNSRSSDSDSGAIVIVSEPMTVQSASEWFRLVTAQQGGGEDGVDRHRRNGTVSMTPFSLFILSPRSPLDVHIALEYAEVCDGDGDGEDDGGPLQWRVWMEGRATFDEQQPDAVMSTVAELHAAAVANAGGPTGQPQPQRNTVSRLPLVVSIITAVLAEGPVASMPAAAVSASPPARALGPPPPPSTSVASSPRPTRKNSTMVSSRTLPPLLSTETGELESFPILFRGSCKTTHIDAIHQQQHRRDESLYEVESATPSVPSSF